MKKNNKNKKGFSFIELMITIAIMAIMSTITLASMNKGRELWAVKTAAREVAATVRETQNYALTGKGLTASSASCNYTFSWTATLPANVYNITGCITQSYTLKNGVIFIDSGSIDFEVPFSMLSGTDPIPIRVQRGESTYSVCVYPFGAIKETADAICPAS